MVAAQHPVSPKEKSKRRALLFLAIVPALLLIAAIKQYAVNVPFGDEWQMIPLFAKWHAHALTFHDLYEQHNEHRILFPKLIFLAFAALTHWNLRAEMFFSVALVAATSAAIYVLIRRTLPDSPRRVALLWVLANLLLFSPSQGENWLWGFQLQVFIPNLCLVAALVTITSAWNSSARIAVAGFFAVVASFSFGNGLLLWPLLALCLLLRREKKMLILIWLAMFAIVCACYFAGYRRHVPPPGHWIEYICYFSAFLGGVLARQREGALLMSPIIIGMAASFLYAAFAVRFLKQRGPDFAKTVPWLIIGAYPLGSAVIAAAARIDSGMGQAVDSRYITISSLLYLSLVMLSVLAASGPDSRETTSSRWLARTASPIATCVIVLTLTGIPWGLRYMRNIQRERIAGLGALQFANVIDVTSALHRHLVNSQTPISLLESVRILDELQLLHHPLRETARIQEKAGVPSEEAQEFGAIDLFQQRDEQTFEVSGWAFLPDDGMAGPCVVLAYRLGEEWFGFALSDTRQSRPDIAHSKNDARYTESGWRKTFRRDAFPAEADHISAWTVDPLSGEVHKLPGSCPLPKS
jgi:hypothetical protein